VIYLSPGQTVLPVNAHEKGTSKMNDPNHILRCEEHMINKTFAIGSSRIISSTNIFPRFFLRSQKFYLCITSTPPSRFHSISQYHSFPLFFMIVATLLSFQFIFATSYLQLCSFSHSHAPPPSNPPPPSNHHQPAPPTAPPPNPRSQCCEKRIKMDERVCD